MALILTALNLSPASQGRGFSNSSWVVSSSNQEQTFAYGSIRHQQWINRDGHLALVVEFTNDPYVDLVNVRQFDDFEFEFPSIRIGADRRTFYFHPSNRLDVPVAVAHPLVGISLLSISSLAVRKIHGKVTAELIISRKES